MNKWILFSLCLVLASTIVYGEVFLGNTQTFNKIRKAQEVSFDITSSDVGVIVTPATGVGCRVFANTTSGRIGFPLATAIRNDFKLAPNTRQVKLTCYSTATIYVTQ